jgi:hypothetical protein
MARGSTLADRANVMWPAATTRRRQAPRSQATSSYRHITQSGTKQRQGRRLRVLQGLSPRRDRTALDTGAGARRDACVAGPTRPAAVLLRLVSHTRSPSWRPRAKASRRRRVALRGGRHRRVRRLAGGPRCCIATRMNLEAAPMAAMPPVARRGGSEGGGSPRRRRQDRNAKDPEQGPKGGTRRASRCTSSI